MIPMDVLLSFLTASILLSLAPGPDNIFVLTQSAVDGPRAGIMVMLGLCTGLIFHTIAVAMGVAVIFQTSALAFAALKYLGAAYLVYLAFLAFRAGNLDLASGEKTPPLAAFALYRRGIVMNITNPKVSIFFLAFLPQFTDPSRGSLTLQMLVLGAVFIFSTFWVFGGIALLAGRLGRWLGQSARAGRILNRGAALVFIGLAAKLALVER